MYGYQFNNSLDSAPWQATGPSMVWNLRGALQLTTNTSVISHQAATKELTPEAVYMIFILLAFAMLTLIGSLLDITGFLTKAPTNEGQELQKKTSMNKNPFQEGGKKSSEITVRMNNWKQFLSCFSVVQNGKSLLSTASDENNISCLDGIRVLCIYMILQCHITTFYPNVLKENFERIASHYCGKIVFPKAFLAIPILLISGILNGYSFSRHYRRSKGKVSWLSLPLRSLIKFTPIEMIVVGFYTFLFPYIGSGPLWPKYDTNPVCRKYWLWNLLYLSNFLPHDKQCILQTWYLACLVQLQIFSPLLLIPIIRMPKVGYSLTAFACVFSFLARFALFTKYNLVENLRVMKDPNSDIYSIIESTWGYFDIMHTRPYTRLCTYSVGIALGCYVYHTKLSNFKKYSMVKIAFGWIMCFIFLWICTHGGVSPHLSVYVIAAKHCIQPLLYICSVSWIVLLCATDQCRFLNRFLSCNIFKILSRLSFPAYLLHMFVVEKYFLSFKEFVDHSSWNLVLTSTYLHLWIIAVSFMFSLIIGIPVLRISDLVKNIYPKKSQQKVN